MDEHERGSASHHKQLWTLLVFQLWYDNFLTPGEAAAEALRSRLLLLLTYGKSFTRKSNHLIRGCNPSPTCTIHYEHTSNPEGIPVVFLHSSPAAAFCRCIGNISTRRLSDHLV